jgi:hypothetical protein
MLAVIARDRDELVEDLALLRGIITFSRFEQTRSEVSHGTTSASSAAGP